MVLTVTLPRKREIPKGFFRDARGVAQRNPLSEQEKRPGSDANALNRVEEGEG
jgi:hypothetical protein